MGKKGFDGFLNMAIDESVNQWGVNFNNSEDSEFYKLASCFMPAFAYLEDKAISVKRGMNIYTAIGQELDDILNNDLFYRIQGGKATGVFTVTGENSIFIPKGSVQVASFNGVTFSNTSEGMTANGFIKLDFESDEPTASANIPAKNIERVIKSPGGITDVQNDIATTGGRGVETDYEYLNRWLASDTSEAWSLDAIIGEVLKVEGVLSASGDRNNTLTDKSGSGGLPAKSIRIVVKGGKTKDICEAIYRKIHTPVTVGTSSYDVVMYPGKTETIRFDRPKQTKIDYKYNIIADDVSGILAELGDYLDELGIGDFVSMEEFKNKKIGDTKKYGIKAMAIRFKRSSESVYKDFFNLNYDEEGVKGDGVSE